MTETGYNCQRCGEELCALLLPGEGKFSIFIRPRRVSKCRRYKPGLVERVCKAQGVTRDDAIAKFRDPDGKEARARSD